MIAPKIIGFLLLLTSIAANGEQISSIPLNPVVSASQGPVEVTRGDILQLEVKTRDDNTDVAWWLGDELICDSRECKLDTTDFSVGEYRFLAVIRGETYLILHEVSIRADAPPPLYVPREITPSKNSTVSNGGTIGNGEWFFIPRRGVATYKQRVPNVSTPKLRIRSGLTAIRPNVLYSTPSGSQLIVTQFGSTQEWLISENSMFKITDGRLELMKGSGLWHLSRAGKEPRSANVLGRTIESTGPALIAATIDNRPEKKIGIVLNIEATNLNFRCDSNQSLIVNEQTFLNFSIDEKGSCQSELNRPVASDWSLNFIKPWFEWWFQDFPLPTDRFRHLGQNMSDLVSDTLKPTKLEQLKDSARCREVLDHLALEKSNTRNDSEFSTIKADCLSKLGLTTEALKHYLQNENNQAQKSEIAFKIAMTLQTLERHKDALQWFEKAKDHGYHDPVTMSKSAYNSAKKVSGTRDEIYWLNQIWLSDSDAQSSALARIEADKFQNQRSKGATFFASTFADSHALPLNLNAVETKGLGYHSSRSVVFDLDAMWWRKLALTSESRLHIQGNHDAKIPFDTRLSEALESTHFINSTLDFNILTDDVTKSDYLIAASAQAGTNISGSERQTDMLGLGVALSKRSSDFQLSVGASREKYFDPNPNGSDVIDIAINRYTEQGDHSHFDFRLYVNFKRDFQSQTFDGTWTLINSDYRTGTLSQYDYQGSEITCSWRRSITGNSSASVSPRILNRSFKLAHQTEQILGANASVESRFFALWDVGFSFNYETRNITKVKSSSYNRSVYGAFLRSYL